MHPIKHRSLADRFGDRFRRGLDHRLVRWMSLGDTQQVWYLRKLFALLDVDLVLDVGGNVGKYSAMLRDRVHYRGAMISVEPLPAMAQALSARFRGDARWALATCALGEAPGTSVLNITQGHEMSSLLQPSNEASERLDRFNTVQDRVEVTVQTLDHLLATHPLAQGAKRIYLKLDVQGYEMQVLRGAVGSLDRIVALQAEASVIPMYEGIPPYHELMRDIEAMGYQLSFLPAHNYTQIPDMVDFDCHFVSRKHLVELGYLRAGAHSQSTALPAGSR